jgi:hypothetical protein
MILFHPHKVIAPKDLPRQKALSSGGNLARTMCLAHRGSCFLAILRQVLC